MTGGTEPCESQVVRQLVELLSRRLEIGEDETILDGDRQFYAEQNARLVVNAERYYRAAFWGGPESWNLRDWHMVETLEALVEHLEQTRQTVKGAVWAHNSHVGDARATEMGRRGELNVGQLVRGRYGDEALIGGFTTFAGPSRPPRTGELWPSARTSGLRVRTAGSGSCTTPGCRAS